MHIGISSRRYPNACSHYRTKKTLGRSGRSPDECAPSDHDLAELIRLESEQAHLALEGKESGIP